MTMRAKVILRKALTYNLRGHKFTKGIPVIVEDAQLIKELQCNGYFSTTVMNTPVKTDAIKKVTKKKLRRKVRK